jgi:ubiquinone/menaquinone biosynthesis C-methylase UbiE
MTFERDTATVAPGMALPPMRVLDVGCGKGDSLIMSGLSRNDFVVGVDMDLHSLRQAAQRVPNGMFVAGRAEELPFADQSFGHVISGVALPYMDIDKALREIIRVLAPEGKLALTLHSFGFAVSDLMRRVRGRRAKPIIGSLWVLLNGAAFNLTLSTFRMPFTRNIETWQTSWAMRRLFRRLGIIERIEAPLMLRVRKSAGGAESPS